MASRRARAFLWLPALWVVMAVALPAQAQQIMVPAGSQHDRVRVSGFFWRAKPGGVLGVAEISDIAGLEDGIDVDETLGFTDAETGFILEGNVAAGRRHHFIFEYARIENAAERSIAVNDIGPIPFIDLVVNVRSNISLREFHAFYNFLFVARPQVEFGVLGGVGWFEAAASLDSVFGRASAKIDQAFPSFGGNLLVNPKGPVRGYVELSGFPKVTIDELSGWQFDLMARLEVFVVRNVGLIVGYRRYRLVFNDSNDGLALDLKWDGLVFGGQARF